MVTQYSHIIDNMTWSYSRLTAFEDCPYSFFLRYILCEDKQGSFFASYGSFLHSIIERILKGSLTAAQAPSYYLLNFSELVPEPAPNETIHRNYFRQGLEYLKGFTFPYTNILSCEQKSNFMVGDKPFVGIIDAVAEDDGLIIIDNKSRDLKPRSGRAKPTKSDAELDSYLRQLYLYAAMVEQEYGRFPKTLEFNCFRVGTWIVEPFSMSEYEEVKRWALELIGEITQTDEWFPSLDFFKCKYLCDMREQCDYYAM